MCDFIDKCSEYIPSCSQIDPYMSKPECFTEITEAKGTQRSEVPSEAPGSAAKCDKDSCKYYSFLNSVTCLFAEGVEFMTREQLYQAIKNEWKSHLKR
jgi:hypothetical protein